MFFQKKLDNLQFFNFGDSKKMKTGLGLLFFGVFLNNQYFNNPLPYI